MKHVKGKVRVLWPELEDEEMSSLPLTDHQVRQECAIEGQEEKKGRGEREREREMREREQ